VPPNAAIRDETGKSKNEYTELPACENPAKEMKNRNRNTKAMLFCSIKAIIFYQLKIKDSAFSEMWQKLFDQTSEIKNGKK
jgi:hypothetical protein